MTALTAGTVVIVTHDLFQDQFALARVYADPTPARIRLQGWVASEGHWGRDHRARMRNCVIATVPQDADMAKVAARLVSAADQHRQAKKEARQRHLARVMEIAEGKA